MKCYQWLMDCRIAVGVVSVPLRLSGHQLVVTILQGPNPLSLLQFPHLGLARIAREAARSLESGQLTFIPGDECFWPSGPRPPEAGDSRVEMTGSDSAHRIATGNTAFG